MVTKPDWENAPEGATHFGPDEPGWHACYHKQEDGEWYGWLADGDTQWDLTVFDHSERHQKRAAEFVKRPGYDAEGV